MPTWVAPAQPIASTFLASRRSMHGVGTVGPDRRYPRQECKIRGHSDLLSPPTTSERSPQFARILPDHHLLDIKVCTSIYTPSPCCHSLRLDVSWGSNAEVVSAQMLPAHRVRRARARVSNHHESWPQSGKLPHSVYLEKAHVSRSPGPQISNTIPDRHMRRSLFAWLYVSQTQLVEKLYK